MGKSQEELVLILIQLRRQSASLSEAIDACKAELDNLRNMGKQPVGDLRLHTSELEEQLARVIPVICRLIPNRLISHHLVLPMRMQVIRDTKVYSNQEQKLRIQMKNIFLNYYLTISNADSLDASEEMTRIRRRNNSTSRKSADLETLKRVSTKDEKSLNSWFLSH